MSEFTDPYPELPLMIDVGGIKYYLGNLKPVELAYKSRSEFKNTFGYDARTEYILRKYMHSELKAKRKLRFSNLSEKEELIRILERRAKQLQSSKEFSSSLLKNTVFQQSYLNIQKLIQDLKGAAFVGNETTQLEPPILAACNDDKKYTINLSDERTLELILELAWILLHPDQVPKDIQCTWASFIKQLDTLRLGDLMSMIRAEQEKRGIQSSLKPLNYLERINLNKIKAAPSIKNALDEVKQKALEIQSENSKKEMENRIKTLLNILEAKKYLNKNIDIDETGLKIIDNDAATRISKRLIENPMQHGGSSTLDKPLGIAMTPMYDYFRGMFDPVYTFIENIVESYTKTNSGTIREIFIPSLLTLLHISNNLNRPVLTNQERGIYGIYRITNVDPRLLDFIVFALNSTKEYVGKYSNNVDKNTFNKQLMLLPTVRLTTLLNSGFEKLFKDPVDTTCIQFCVVGNNLTIPDRDTFLSSSQPHHNDVDYNELNTFFNDKSLYIIYTKSENCSESIPMNLFEIDYDAVNIEEKALSINNLDDNHFNKLRQIKGDNNASDLFLDNLISLEKYVILNDSELAMSIFIAFKELMPK